MLREWQNSFNATTKWREAAMNHRAVTRAKIVQSVSKAYNRAVVSNGEVRRGSHARREHNRNNMPYRHG